jgi:integrase/recombinase XerD
LSGGHLNDIVKQAAENAGIQEVLYKDSAGRRHFKITSHTLRHSFAMHWLENGGSMEGLSKNLAHSSVTTTEIYGEILDERASEEYEKFAPDIDF